MEILFLKSVFTNLIFKNDLKMLLTFSNKYKLILPTNARISPGKATNS